MIKITGTAKVTARISQTFEQYERKAYDIFKYYAAEIMTYFETVQARVPAETKGEFWTNHTFRAAQAFFAKAYQVPGANIGVTLAYTADPFYTKYLEYGHDGRFAAFPKLIERFHPLIIHDLKVLYGEI